MRRIRRAAALTVTLLWTAGAARGEAPPPAVTAAFGARAVSTTDALLLTLSRPLDPAEGRLAVLVGTTDCSDLFTAAGTAAMFTPAAWTLPVGTTEVAAYLVTPAGEWRPLGRFPLTVAAPEAMPRALRPTLDLAFKGQLAEDHRPDTNAPPRATFQDLSMQAALEADGTSGDATRKASVKLVGTTFRNEALRFGALGEAAPLIDLSGYTAELGHGRARLAVGSLNRGSHRHLVNQFDSRGASATLPLGRPAELTVAALSGSQIVGWDNPLGIDTRAHRILVGTVGVELVPARPGGVRLEVSALTGSVLPLANYNQGLVRDAATSRGLGVRVLFNDGSGRVRLEGSLSRSRFRNAADLELESGLPVAAEEASAADARYGRAEVDLLRLGSGTALPVTFTVSAEHEQVDPLYRSVGAQPDADRRQDAFGTTLRLGEGAVQVTHARAEDNLGRVASILTTLTRQVSVEASLPLASLAAGGGRRSPLLPALGYTLARVRQLGAGLPPDSDFSATHVPDQLSVSHTARAQWQGETHSLGYAVTVSRQDNRQPGRETADFAQETHQASFGFVRSERFQASLDFQLERARNEERSETGRVRRVGINLDRPARRGPGLTAIVGASWTDAEGAGRTGRNLEADLMASWRLRWSKGTSGPSATVFVRWATQRARALDPVLLVDDDRASWQLTAGLNLSAFSGSTQ